MAKPNASLPYVLSSAQRQERGGEQNMPARFDEKAWLGALLVTAVLALRGGTVNLQQFKRSNCTTEADQNRRPTPRRNRATKNHIVLAIVWLARPVALRRPSTLS